MATATTPMTTSLDALREEHRAAAGAMASAHGTVDALVREIRGLVKTIDPPEDDAPTVDVVSRLEAQLALGAAKTALQQAQLEAHRADAHEAAARVALDTALAAGDNKEAGDLMTRLIPILRDQARPIVDMLRALKERRPTLDLYTFPELQSADKRGAFEPTLDCVIRSARAYGWLPEDADASGSK